mmetsp:Transcript_12509/g.28200  ORF Transcript_12509/g.28200 Transcript_12509/m.28200 type:complete len:259 (-) Transcript_12509:264-1040(-)
MLYSLSALFFFDNLRVPVRFLKIKQDSSFKDTGLCQQVLDGFRHALHTAQQGPGVSRNGNAIFFQGILQVSRPSLPRFVVGLRQHGNHLDTGRFPFGKSVHAAQVLGRSLAVVEAARTSSGDGLHIEFATFHGRLDGRQAGSRCKEVKVLRGKVVLEAFQVFFHGKAAAQDLGDLQILAVIHFCQPVIVVGLLDKKLQNVGVGVGCRGHGQEQGLLHAVIQTYLNVLSRCCKLGRGFGRDLNLQQGRFSRSTGWFVGN